MTPKQERFVSEYLIDLNATQAATRAGYSARTANEQGARLLANASVRYAIQQAQAERAKRVEINQDEVLRNIHTIAMADPRELCEFRRTCCRYCWGEKNRYQRTAGEMERDREAHEAKIEKAEDGRCKHPGDFDEKGGIGYDPTRETNRQCGECFGEGIGRVHLHDTRRLSAAAARLYAGVKETKDGLEVKTLDQDAALVNLGRHLGLFKDKVDVNATVTGAVTYRAHIERDPR